MAFQLLINSVNYTLNFDRASWTATENTQANGASMSVEIEIPHTDLAPPLGGQHVKFLRDAVVEFAGRVNTVEETTPHSPSAHAYQVDCIDYTVDLDSKLLQTTISAQLAGDQVRQLVGIVGKGFTSNNVVDGPMVAEQQIDLSNPSSVITQIAEAIEHQWYVDYNRDLNFFYILDRPAPLAEVDLDNDTATYFDASVDEDWSQVKNVIYLSGATAKSSVPDTVNYVADGDTKFTALGYPPWSGDPADIQVTVDAVPKEILFDGIDGFAGDGMTDPNVVFLCLDNHGVRFPDNNAPVAGSNVAMSYAYGYEPVIKVEDPVSIAAMMARENSAEAPSDGIHEFKFEIPSLRVENESSIWDYGQLLLSRYSMPVYTVRFGSWVQGWKAGQHLRIFSASDKRNFDKVCYVKSVTKRILKSSDGQALFAYQIEASSSPFPG